MGVDGMGFGVDDNGGVVEGSTVERVGEGVVECPESINMVGNG